MLEDKVDAKGFCQACRRLFWKSSCDPHHKLQVSLGGKDDPENIVAIHRACHNFIHDPEHIIERHVETQEANVINGKFIEWTQEQFVKLIEKTRGYA